MNTLSHQELSSLLHTLLSQPDAWQVVRIEVDLGYETGLPEVLTLGFRSTSGHAKRLRFSNPRMNEFGPLQFPEPTALYVADLSSLGWSPERSVEVGVWEEDRPVLFWAASVEEVA